MKEIKSYAPIGQKGEAYGFFDCRASKQLVGTELPFIRQLVGTPSALELSLDENDGNLQGAPKLRKIAQQASNSGLKYIMSANYPGASNEEAADEIAVILNQAYQSPLYRKGEPFRGGIRMAA